MGDRSQWLVIWVIIKNLNLWVESSDHTVATFWTRNKALIREYKIFLQIVLKFNIKTI